VATLCTVVCFSACKEKKFRGFTKTETGLYYKITTKNKDGKVPQEGDYLSLTVSFDADFDSTIVIPSHDRGDVLRPSVFGGDIFEAYSLLKEGEEGEFYIKADSFIMYFMGAMPPPTVKPEDMLRFKIKLNEIKSKEVFEEEMAVKEQEYLEMLEQKKAEEKTLLDEYITAQKIKVKPTASGLYYVETLKGKGAKAENGKKVTVHYTGKLLNGTIFDSSVERGEPIEFVLGMGMIPGFAEGIALMKEGGKATLILPSDLAYGERGAGEKIPPVTPIVFDVELIKVADVENAAVNLLQ
jgi:FKBP-type peptidyl-prolyl cis-trans isomerase